MILYPLGFMSTVNPSNWSGPWASGRRWTRQKVLLTIWILASSQQKKVGVSKNNGIPKSSILIGFSIINHPFWGTPNFWKHPNGCSGCFRCVGCFGTLRMRFCLAFRQFVCNLPNSGEKNLHQKRNVTGR